MKRLLAITFFIIFAAHLLYAQQRGVRVQPSKGQHLEQRVALIIGNSAYKDSPLLNPHNDAKDMSQALTSLGFEVIHKDNATQIEMKKAIKEFGEKIKKGGIGLFYYAGHGVQVNGRNYLVPVGAEITNEYEVEYEAVDAGFVLAQMESAGNRLNIVILDACRNNPFARSFRSTKNGLASIDAPVGTIIAYATAPGSVASDGYGKNGIYTQELLRAINLPGLKIEEVFKSVRAAVRERTKGKQVPWESSSLEGDFYFTEPLINSKSNTESTLQSTNIATEIEYWDLIKGSTNPEDFNLYLRKYPNGRFEQLAKDQLKSLEAKSKEEKNQNNDNTKSNQGGEDHLQGSFHFVLLLDNFEPYNAIKAESGTLAISSDSVLWTSDYRKKGFKLNCSEILEIKKQGEAIIHIKTQRVHADFLIGYNGRQGYVSNPNEAIRVLEKIKNVCVRR